MRDAATARVTWSVVVLLSGACLRSGHGGSIERASGVELSSQASQVGSVARGGEGALVLAAPWHDYADDSFADPAHHRVPHEFYFTRAAYSGPVSRGFPSWSVDYPKADVQFLLGLRRLVPRIDAYPYDNPILLDDPDLSRYPFLYAVEVGYMTLSPAETQGLRRYLLAGGFLVIDDFWGTREWSNWAHEIAAVLPEYAIVDLPLDHPIFHCFYDVSEVLQVPNVGQGRNGGPTWERDGFVPVVRGIFDDNDRLMVVINWNTDLGDAWEWAEDPFYPLRFSTYAYQMGVNFIVYALSH